MNNKLVTLLGILALTAAPLTCARAQQGPGGPGGPGEEDVEMWESGPGPGQHGKGPDMRGAKGAEDGDEEGGRQVTVKVRKMKGGGPGMFRGQEMGGGPGFMGGGFLEEDEALALIKKHDAAFAKKLGDLKTTAPVKYRMAMQMARRSLSMARMEEDEALERDAVRNLSLDLDVKDLSRQYDKAADADKAAIKTELKAKLSEVFDLKTRQQEARLKRMTSDLAKLQKKLEARKTNKAKIVDQRADQLTGEGDGW